MRPLKFRAWDSELGKMFDPVDVYNVHFWPDGLVLMQFTGLTDRHGKEIYEGDVVSIPAEDGRTNTFVVRFGIARREMASGWVVDISSFYFDSIGSNFKAFPIVKNFLGVHDLTMMKILGNIYEHPHLVEPT